jgi:hypothetical protein
MRFSEERYQRDMRRLALARRMAHLEARTRTIVEWTGLTRLRVRAVCRNELGECAEAVAIRSRGPVPKQIFKFMNSPAARSEAGALAASCQLHGVFPVDKGDAAVKRLPSVERGDRLCAAYEGYLAHVPEPRYRFEQAVLLVKALVRADEIVIGQCFSCQSVLVTERLARGAQYCAVCRANQLAVKQHRRTQVASEPVVLEPKFEQQSLF